MADKQGDGQHGGYRKPNHPAPVSGPGAASRRTDGGPADKQPIRDMSGGNYGDRKDLHEIQGGAPMSTDPRQNVIPLDAPSERPDEPVTAGADAGPGPTMNDVGIESDTQQDISALQKYLPALEYMASLPNSTPGARAFVRRVRAGA